MPDRLNALFHDAYDGARSRAKDDVPILVVLADSLIVCKGDQRRSVSFADPLFDALKSAAHAPIAVFAMLSTLADKELGSRSRLSLGNVREALLGVSLGSTDALDEHARNDVRAVAALTFDFVDRVLKLGRVGREGLENFAGQTGPLLLRLTSHATELRLNALDRATETAILSLNSGERSALRVVVAGDHQARARSLAMQYFEKRRPRNRERVLR